MFTRKQWYISILLTWRIGPTATSSAQSGTQTTGLFGSTSTGGFNSTPAQTGIGSTRSPVAKMGQKQKAYDARNPGTRGSSQPPLQPQSVNSSFGKTDSVGRPSIFGVPSTTTTTDQGSASYSGFGGSPTSVPRRIQRTTSSQPKFRRCLSTARGKLSLSCDLGESSWSHSLVICSLRAVDPLNSKIVNCFQSICTVSPYIGYSIEVRLSPSVF